MSLNHGLYEMPIVTTISVRGEVDFTSYRATIGRKLGPKVMVKAKLT